MEDPSVDSQDDSLNVLDDLFLYIYTFEAILKIGALGLYFECDAYLKDPWNILDFIIVVIGWITKLVSKGITLTALRSFRILRPLRSISSIQGFKLIFLALMRSFKQLISTMTLLLFFLLIFSIAGVQM